MPVNEKDLGAALASGTTTPELFSKLPRVSVLISMPKAMG